MRRSASNHKKDETEFPNIFRITSSQEIDSLKHGNEEEIYIINHEIYSILMYIQKEYLVKTYSGKVKKFHFKYKYI